MNKRVAILFFLLLVFSAASVSYYGVTSISSTNTGIKTTEQSATTLPTGDISTARNSQTGSVSSSVDRSIVVVIIPKNSSIFGGANFTPSEFTVVIGVNNTIEWINEDVLSAHSVTALEVPTGFAKFDPVIIDSGQRFTMKLTVPGIYIYYCLWHPGWLKGTITVKA